MPKNATSGQGSVLVVGYKDTKDVLFLVFGLAKAYEKIKADGKVDWTDVQYLLPILFSIGPAIEGFENVSIELKMATKEEGEELKLWIKENVELNDKSVEEFIEACFAIVLDLWYVFRTFLFVDGQSMLKNETGKVITKNEDGSEDITIGG